MKDYTATNWPWPDELDALTAAPRHHKLLFENESVRVLDALIPPGEMVTEVSMEMREEGNSGIRKFEIDRQQRQKI